MKSGKKKLPTDQKKRPVIYWDTCVLLAWMKNEVRPAGDMEGLDEVVALVRKSEAVLVTSTLTRAEILKSKQTKEAMDKLTRLFRRPNVVPLILDTQISILTSELRDHYCSTAFELLTPDAIHLATAIHHSVTEFQTFDGADESRKPRDKKKTECGLLKLNGNIAGHNLKVCKPNAAQLNLLVNVQPISIDNPPALKVVPSSSGAKNKSLKTRPAKT